MALAIGPAIVLLLLLLLASGAHARRLRLDGVSSRWGGALTSRAHGARRPLAFRATVKPAISGSATIEGTVRDAAKGTGIEGIEVCAYPSGPFEGEEIEEFEEEEATCSSSGAGGVYAIERLPAGEYTVWFSTPFNSTLDYVAQQYDEGRPIGVKAGATVTEVDAELSKGAEIEGHVTKAAGGSSLAGIEVCAWGVEVDAEGCAETSPAGIYLITGLPAGSVTVAFRSQPGGTPAYATQFYDDQSSYRDAQTVTVEVEHKLEGIDAAMVVGAKIEGRVTIGESNEASDETLVCAIEERVLESCALTDGAGGYTLSGLASNSYTVIFSAEGPPEYYRLAFSESEATPVTVSAPSGNAYDIDAELPTLPQRILAPHVTGTAAVGSTLTCEEGTYSAFPAPTITVQWLRDGEPIAGATSPAYTVQAADAGHQLQCEVTATNVAGWLWVKTAGIPIGSGALPSPVETVNTTLTFPTPPTAPTGGVLSSVTVASAVAVASRVTVSHGHSEVRMKCSGGPCKGTLELLERVVVDRHARTIVLATGSFSLSAGSSAAVGMRLTAAGRSCLAHAGHRAVAAKLKLSLHGGATTTHAVSAA